jgi:phosphoribosyl-ATP pyrophosphohydrolase
VTAESFALIEEAFRGFLLSRHLPFSDLDSWADDLVAIVREHLDAAALQGAVGVWRDARWPMNKTVDRSAMKVAEEAGEVVGAAVKMAEGRASMWNLATEAADTVIALYGLAHAAGFDLDLHVRERWAEVQAR